MNLTDFQVGSYIEEAVNKVLPSIVFTYTAGNYVGTRFFKLVDWYYAEWCGFKSASL